MQHSCICDHVLHIAIVCDPCPDDMLIRLVYVSILLSWLSTYDDSFKLIADYGLPLSTFDIIQFSVDVVARLIVLIMFIILLMA